MYVDEGKVDEVGGQEADRDAELIEGDEEASPTL